MNRAVITDHSTVELIQSNISDDMVAMSAWISNGLNTEDRLAEPGRKDGLINFLVREKHLSPLEHGSMTLKVQTPLFVRSEWHRHRTQSFNERSLRYSKFKGEIYVPGPLRPVVQSGKIGAYQFEHDDALNAVIRHRMERKADADLDEYYELLDLGAAPEVARMVLSVSCMTEFYATANLRNWLQFLDLRQSDQALYEIRQAAHDVAAILEQQAPLTVGAWNTYRS
mgnify:FL=1